MYTDLADPGITNNRRYTMDINLVFVLMTMLSNVGVQFAPQLEAAATFDPTCNAKVVKQEGTNYGYDSVEHCLIKKSDSGNYSIARTKKA